MKKIVYILLISALLFSLFSACTNSEVIDDSYSITIEENSNLHNLESSVANIMSVVVFTREFFSGSVDESVIILEDLNPYPEINSYALIEGYSSISELKDYILKIYSSRVANEYFFTQFEHADYPPFIIEVNNNLYCDYLRYGVGSGYNYDVNNYEIISLTQDQATIKINTTHSNDTTNTFETYLILTYENNNWVYNELVL